MLSGVILSTAGGIDLIVRHMQAILIDTYELAARVYLTGGDAVRLESWLSCQPQRVDDLVLRGAVHAAAPWLRRTIHEYAG
jgi:hypothetical protein